MLRAGLALILAGSASVALAQANAPQKPRQPVEIDRDDPDLLVAIKSWATGEPVKAAAAYSSQSFVFSRERPTIAQRQFLADWIVALTYADPAAAQAKLNEWEAADPQSGAGNVEALRRVVLHTRILLEQERASLAQALVQSTRAELDRIQQEKLAAYQSRRKAKRRDPAWLRPTPMPEFAEAHRILRGAEFLIATNAEGEAAFAQFSGKARNPFWNEATALYLQSNAQISCASSGLDPKDWLIAEVGYDAATRESLFQPFAHSKGADLAPFMETVSGWSFAFRRMNMIEGRQHIMLRCTRAVPPAPDGRPDYDFLWSRIERLNTDAPAGFSFDVFRQPISVLENEGQWLRIVNLAYRPNPLAPHVQKSAQAAILNRLLSEAKPDAAAVALVRQWMLPIAQPQQTGQTANIIPGRVAEIDAMRKIAEIPPRVLAFFELKLGEMHEIAGQPELARTIYQGIANRLPDVGEAKVAEAVKAQLRLAALSDAGGKANEAEAIFARLGLSPDQCSTYQARPAITSFRTPDYPTAAIRDELEGTVQFEFDLGESGTATNFRVLAATPPFVFDSATITSFSKAKFAPATRGGNALSCEAAVQTFVWRMPDY